MLFIYRNGPNDGPRFGEFGCFPHLPQLAQKILATLGPLFSTLEETLVDYGLLFWNIKASGESMLKVLRVKVCGQLS